ncbi:MAG: hypothetical protein KIS92_03620 [Planctomycetota bacterium]|nr:hypothetical protein [Planctomycetota bacterium]
MHPRRFVFVLAACLALGRAHAEEGSKELQALQERVESLSRKLESQEKLIQSQDQRLKEQENLLTVYRPGGGKIAQGPAGEVLERLKRAEQQSAEALKAAARRKPNDFNMSIGAAVDTAFRYFDGNNAKADRPAGNDFQLRGAEVVFYADVDPYFKSYLVLSAEADAADNDEAVPGVEEAAIYTTSLSHVQVKGGRFFVPFGRLSPVHNHDLPFVDRPLSLENYVGGESGGDGVQVRALLPTSHFFQVTGGVFNKVGGEYPLHQPLEEIDATNSRRGGAELTYFLKLLTSFELGESHSFELGASAIEVPDQAKRRNLVNLEFTYRWHPAGSPLRERLVWGTELMRNEVRVPFLRDFTVDADGDGVPDDADGDGVEDTETRLLRRNVTGWGGYSYVEYFLSRHWSLGGRADFFQPADPTEDRTNTRNTYEQTYSLFATYRFSEFGRIRGQLNRHEYRDGDSSNEFLLQWTVFWGAHTHNFDQR